MFSLQAASIQLVVLGFHAKLSTTLLASWYLRTILDVVVFQMTRLLLSSPLARYLPQGETANDLTQVVWKSKSIET